MIELLIYRDDREVARYMLGSSGSTVLGRGDDCELLLDDSAVSRRHARIRVENGRVFLTDLGSGNGTWFQGLRVREMELENGALFRIEPFDLRITISATNAQVHAATRPVEASRPDDEPAALFDASDPAFGGSASQAEASVSVPRAPGGSAAIGPRLERVRGSDAPILLTRADITLGRGDDATFPLRDAAISRIHARLTFGSDRFVLEDLKSANGTFVNGERIAGARILKDGDRLKMGDTELLFVDPSASTVSAVDAVVPTKPVLLEEDDAPRPRTALADQSPQPQARRSVTPHPRRPTPPPREATPEPSLEPELAIEIPDAPEFTEAGAPPPSAFAFAAERPVPVFEETEPGGAAMELDPLGGDAPASDRRRTMIAAAVSIGLALFLAVVMMRPSDERDPNGPDPEPNRMQNTMLLSLERLAREADEALAKEPKDFAFALDRYQRIAVAARNPELEPFRRVRELRVTAPETAARLHEAMLLKALREETERRALGDAEKRKRVDALLAAANDGIAAGRRGSLDGFDRALKALADVLALVPGHSQATPLAAATKPERDALAERYAAANRERIDRECKQLHDRATKTAAARSPKALQAAVALYDQILEKDRTGITPWPARARADRTRAVASLGETASPLRESARKSMSGQDWRTARKFLRTAVGVNPYDPQIREELAAAQAECERAGSHHFKMAQAYNEARNYAEAKKECAIVKTFADRSTDRLWQLADELEKSIGRALAN